MIEDDPSRPLGYVNPLKWGAVVALVAALIVVFAEMVGTEKPDNILLESPLRAAPPAFFFGWLAANIRNWLGRR